MKMKNYLSSYNNSEWKLVGLMLKKYEECPCPGFIFRRSFLISLATV